MQGKGSKPTRRQFLATTAATALGAVAFTGCVPPAHELQAQGRGRLAEDLLTAYENFYATTRRQCAAGCGLLLRSVEGRAKKPEGHPAHPLTPGKLCARRQATFPQH